LSDFPPLIYCEDLESSNGTYVNDVLIGKITQERIGHLLCDGDEIEIRPLWKFRFRQFNGQLTTRSKGLWSDLEVRIFHSTCVRQLKYFSLYKVVMKLKIECLGKDNLEQYSLQQKHQPRSSWLAKSSIWILLYKILLHRKVRPLGKEDGKRGNLPRRKSKEVRKSKPLTAYYVEFKRTMSLLPLSLRSKL